MISLDCETTGLFIHKGCVPFMVTSCTDEGQRYVWEWEVDPFTRASTIPRSIQKDIVKTLQQHNEIVFHNANFDIRALETIGINRDYLFDNYEIHDTMVMSHAYQSIAKHGLKEQAVLRCGISDTDETALADITKAARLKAKKLGWCIAEKDSDHEAIEGTKGSHYKCDYWIPKQLAKELEYESDHPWYTACLKYGGLDAERTICLFVVLKELLESEANESRFQHVTGTLYDKYNEARQLIPKLLDMQAEGLPLLSAALEDSINLFRARKEESLSYLRQLSHNKAFNPQSPNQLREVLFDFFKFEPIKQTSVGPSTDKDVISALIKQCPLDKGIKIPDKFKFLIALKEFRKEKTTEGYLINYRVHSKPISNSHRIITPSFSQTGTNSSRLSCKEPNMTNVGKKNMSNPLDDIKDKHKAAVLAELLDVEDNLSFSLRNVFGPLPGEHWTCIDYDQFQLRIFATVSESDDLIEAFNQGKDIHQVVARTIFQKDEISDVERTAAKAINFGLLFGAGAKKIELLAGVPGLYDMFMANFPRAKRYLDKQSRIASYYGYVHTVGGYRLYVPRDRAYAASCYVIQGTEAEIVRNAIVNVSDYQQATPYRLTLMVHDELIFRSKRHDAASLNNIMRIMEDTGKQIGIPCKVDAKYTTTNWATRTKEAPVKQLIKPVRR
jgi:DNA polymerase I-like protein with 3'-5' exonuclease and polymerase domains